MENLIKKIKQEFNNFLLNGKNIDRLMTDKVEDYTILKELPQPIRVGNRTLYVGNFNFDNEFNFFHQWAEIIGLLSARIINMKLMDERRKELFDKCKFELLAKGANLTEFFLIDKWLYKNLRKLVYKYLIIQQQYITPMNKATTDRELVRWKNKIPWRYFKKWCSKEELVQIAYLIYFYNFDSQKKSLKLLAEVLDISRSVETYIPFWLHNLSGLTGRFALDQVPDIASVFKDSPSSENMGQTNKQNKDEELDG